jgi:cytochrome c oxidase subunit 4
MLGPAAFRAARSTPLRTRLSGLNAARAVALQTRASSHAISNPTLANIEQRWETLPPQEQADLWMALRDRMKGDWHELTLHEKKACKPLHPVFHSTIYLELRIADP